MKRLSTIYSLAGLVLITTLLNSCAAPKAIEYRDFKNFTIEKLGFSISTVKMDLVYFNPNSYGLQLKSMELDIFINDTYLGHTGQDYQVTIPGKTDFTIPLKMDIDMKNLFKNGFNALVKNQVVVKVSGSVKVGKANVFISFPIRYEGTQSFTLF